MKTLSQGLPQGELWRPWPLCLRMMRQRMYWQQLEKLTSEKETKLNWGQVVQDFCLSQAFPQCPGQEILLQKNKLWTPMKRQRAGKEIWVKAATGGVIFLLDRRLLSIQISVNWGLFFFIFKTSPQGGCPNSRVRSLKEVIDPCLSQHQVPESQQETYRITRLSTLSWCSQLRKGKCTGRYSATAASEVIQDNDN